MGDSVGERSGRWQNVCGIFSLVFFYEKAVVGNIELSLSYS